MVIILVENLTRCFATVYVTTCSYAWELKHFESILQPVDWIVPFLK